MTADELRTTTANLRAMLDVTGAKWDESMVKDLLREVGNLHPDEVHSALQRCKAELRFPAKPVDVTDRCPSLRVASAQEAWASIAGKTDADTLIWTDLTAEGETDPRNNSHSDPPGNAGTLTQQETRMATQEDVINHLRALSKYEDRPLCDDDGTPYYAYDGNCDDTYQRGIEDGAIELAKALIHSLDTGAELPDLPDEDEDEDEDEVQIPWLNLGFRLNSTARRSFIQNSKGGNVDAAGSALVYGDYVMKCACGCECKRRFHDWAEYPCGMPGVTLYWLEIQTCPRCDEEWTVVPKITQLHAMLEPNGTYEFADGKWCKR